MNITYVYGDDWNALYVDGKLFSDGHDILISTVIEAISQKLPLYNIKYKQVECDLNWLESVGCYPEKLEDVTLI